MKTNKIILPTYTCKLPSSGKVVKYRPFTVMEEKALLLALQENDIDTIAIAIKNTIEVCTSNEVDTTKVPYYDIEFLFMNIRAKSVGELIDLVGSCDCDPKAKTEFNININDITVEPKPSGNFTVKIPDTEYTMVFTHPSLDDFIKTFKTEGSNATETVANCIVQVYTTDEVMDWNFKEKLEFVESMTSKQQKDIAKFLADMPLVKLDASYRCRACGKAHEQVLSGFDNFFV